MNTIDLIVVLALIVAVWNGWRQGFIVQIGSLAGLVGAIWLASRYGTTVGGWLKLDPSIATAGGFVTILIVVVIAVAILARIVRKVCRIAGFGVPDIVLGVVVAVTKTALLLSVLFTAFDRLNQDYTLIGAPTIEKSITYKPLMRLSTPLAPLLEKIGDQIPRRAQPAEQAPDQQV